MASLAEVLEWKYGGVAGTKQVDPTDISQHPKMEIWYWNHPDNRPQPSAEQLEQDFIEYEEYLAAENIKRISREGAEQAFIGTVRQKVASELTIEEIEQYRRIQIAKEFNLAME